jgi:hypothetical protein
MHLPNEVDREPTDAFEVQRVVSMSPKRIASFLVIARKLDVFQAANGETTPSKLPTAILRGIQIFISRLNADISDAEAHQNLIDIAAVIVGYLAS